MRITIEIDSKSEIEKLSALFKTLHGVRIVSASDNIIPIVKGNKKINPNDLFGIWAGNPRSIDAIRKEAWHRKPHAEQ